MSDDGEPYLVLTERPDLRRFGPEGLGYPALRDEDTRGTQAAS
ncbi:hypothetical protein [Streptomyces sp. NEAU-L66]